MTDRGTQTPPPGAAVDGAERAATRPELSVVAARVFREGWGSWWAEVWVPRTAADPPVLFKAMRRAGWPDEVEGCKRVGLSLRGTRRSAHKAARLMRDRYEAGLPCDSADEQPTVEMVA